MNGSRRPSPDLSRRNVLRPKLGAYVALFTAMMLVLPGTPAAATPVSERRAQAAAVKGQIDKLDLQVEMAAEDYNQAQERYVSVSADLSRNKARLAKMRKRIARLTGRLQTRADHMYRNGPASVLEVLLGSTSFEDFITTWSVLTSMNKADAEVVKQIKADREEAAKLQSKLVKAQAEAHAARDRMAAKKATIDSKLAKREQMLKGIEKEIESLEQAGRMAREAASPRSVWTFPSRGDLGGNPRRSAHGSVVPIAMKYIGYPYVWGAAGPNSFDCSGFTMFVYRQIGISLPHHAASQYGLGEHVSRANLKPGDLVFFYSPIHHVGIYVGGGNFIHAPGTGKRVRIDSLSSGSYASDYAGATRP